MPPCPPDLNPIEKIWAKVKSNLRSTAARTRVSLWEALGAALATVTAQDCQNCFRHCGYAATIECELL